MPLQCSLPNLSLSWLVFLSLKNVAIIIWLQNTLKWTEGADPNTDFGLRMLWLWRRSSEADFTSRAKTPPNSLKSRLKLVCHLCCRSSENR